MSTSVTAPRITPLALITSAIFVPLIFLLVVLWHPILLLSRLLGTRIFWGTIAVGNLLALQVLRITGARLSVSGREHLPATGPLIIVSNHQGYVDIPILLWELRRFRPRFVAKRSLTYWIPSVSYVLRQGGSSLINRKNGHQAMPSIRRMAILVNSDHAAACIFPEGTRERDGQLKRFKKLGLRTLLEEMPQAPVVPVVLEGGWKIMVYHFLPVPFGTTLYCTFLEAIDRSRSDDEVIACAEERIRHRYRPTI